MKGPWPKATVSSLMTGLIFLIFGSNFLILSFLRNYRIRERRLWYFQSGLPLAICQKASYHNCKINSSVQVLFELLQTLYSLLKNLRLAINHLCYFRKNLFAQAIYCLCTKYSLKGLQFSEKNYWSPLTGPFIFKT